MSLHSNTGSHPAFDVGHQAPSHEPDSDPTGQMDHMTLTGSWSHGWTVTGSGLEVSSSASPVYAGAVSPVVEKCG